MAASIDQQFIEYIVKSLVNNPDAVKIERRIDEKGVLLELSVDPEDLGRVIGKRGATAQSLRTLLRALGTKNDARYNLKIVDTGEPGTKSAPIGEASEESVPAAAATGATAADATADDEDIVEEERVEEVTSEEEPSDVISRTRAELADLDDLDV
jgi:predicted RNA-binding protein YlqC (UPF0109 family)